MKKIKKFFKHPNIFLRDYFNKKYPGKNIEQPFFEFEENYIIQKMEKLEQLERKSTISTNIQDPIDIVFTWVNNQDPIWQEKISKYINLENNIACNLSTNESRFKNRNEIFYSVNSVLKYMPWVRHIYIITDNQNPTWFEDNNKITIIDHLDIIDKKYLPTFNSHVIEAHLHKIPHLSENFIYFNDDVFVARELSKEHFFHSNGIASIFLADKYLNKFRLNGIITPTLLASEHCCSLLRREYNKEINMPLVHSYVPLKKSIFELAWNIYGKEINGFLTNKFRGKNDLNLATFLVPWLMYLEGKSVPAIEICYYFNIYSNQANTFYTNLIDKKNYAPPHSFCANDFINTGKSEKIFDKKLVDFLSQYYK